MTSAFRVPTGRIIWIAAAAYAVAGGGITLVGWMADIPRLTDWWGSGISMFPNAAICSMLCGCSLLLVRDEQRSFRTLSRLMAAAAALLAVLTLSQHILDTNLRIDTLLFDKPWGQRASAAPMRMGPPASLDFALLGVALFLSSFGTPARRLAAGLGLVVLALSSLPLVGYLFGASQLYSIAQLTGIALQTASIIAMLAIGVGAASPDVGLGGLLARRDAGGLLARRVALPLIAVSIGLGLLRIRGEQLGLYDSAFGTAARTLAEIALLLALLWWAGNGISRAERSAKAESRARRISDERLQVALTVSRMWAWFVDFKRNVIEQSAKASEINGLPPSVPAEVGWECVPAGDRQRLMNAFAKAVAENGEFAEDYRWVRPDNGETIWVNSRGRPEFDAAGDPVGIFGTSIDISERHRMEVELREADRRKDEFLAVLSHELRTPLNSMRGWATLLRAGNLSEAQRLQALETIARNIDAQKALVEDILDVSRIISGKLTIQTERCRLQPIVENAVEEAGPAAELHKVVLTARIDPTAAFVEGDPLRLKQVLSNLLNNAIKFTPAGGNVEIRLKRQGSMAKISVSDTGIGISPAMLPRIFERFEQADSSMRRQHGGLGLGLAIARHLVALHSGSVTVESPGENEGSTFTIRLPLADHPTPTNGHGTAAAEAGSGADKILSGFKLLVVEDDADSREMISAALGGAGADVMNADSARMALELLRKQPFDLLISDLGMPQMDGFELISTIRDELDLGPDVLPAIAVSGYASAQDRERSHAAGYQIHVPKPVDPTALLNTIRAMKRESRADPVRGDG